MRGLTPRERQLFLQEVVTREELHELEDLLDARGLLIFRGLPPEAAGYNLFEVGPPGPKTRLALTCDWLARSLTF